MKKTLCLLLCLIFLCAIAGCGGPAPTRGGKLNVVATIFPEYDWTEQILGEENDNVELTLLLDNGVDLHSFQPSVQDMVTIAECDLLIYVGGVSDKWIDDALANAGSKRPKTIKLMSVLGEAAKEEEIVEGMQADEEEDSGDGVEYDEHVWLSLRNASLFCEAIAKALCELDPEGKTAYEANLKAYLEALSSLDRAYQDAIGSARVQTLLFGDRFPFRYLTDDYDLAYCAAFVGCSAETEASFETVAFLADKLNELDLRAVLTIETGDGYLAKTIAEASGRTDVQILQLNSMQAVTAAELSAGASYLDIMQSDLDTLRQALQ